MPGGEDAKSKCLFCSNNCQLVQLSSKVLFYYYSYITLLLHISMHISSTQSVNDNCQFHNKLQCMLSISVNLNLWLLRAVEFFSGKLLTIEDFTLTVPIPGKSVLLGGLNLFTLWIIHLWQILSWPLSCIGYFKFNVFHWF